MESIYKTPAQSLRGDRFAVIPEAVLYADIGPNAVRLYGVLARYVGANDYAWPSRETLATRMRCTKRTVDAAITELVKIGVLTYETRVSKTGHRTSSAYFLHGVIPETLAVQNLRHDAQILHIGGAESAQERESVKESQLLSPNGDLGYSEKFERLWAAYPRKSGKRAAYRACRTRVKNGATYEELFTAAVRYAEARHGVEDRFIKLAATFYGPDDWWREWSGPLTASEVTSTPRDDDWEKELKRRRAESAPPPENFAASIKARITGKEKA